MLTPAVGGQAVNALAIAVTTIFGTTRRVTFMIPASIQVAGPTAYNVGISGSTSSGTDFASSNTASLTINPGASLSSVNPNIGQQGQRNLNVTISGQGTSFVQGATQASFGAGISVGAAPPGGVGPVTVINATTATAVLNIASAATVGTNTVTAQTGVEQASLSSGFRVNPGTPAITSLNPASGQQGQTLNNVVITGAFTRFTQSAPTVTFSNSGVSASNVQATDNTHLTATLTIAANTAAGSSDVTVMTGSETATGKNLFTVGNPPATIVSVNPSSGQQGQVLTGVVITGLSTHFTQATPTVTFSNSGVTASSIAVTDNTHLTLTVTIVLNAPAVARNVTVVTGSETATGMSLFTVGRPGGPTITDFNPKSAPAGTLVTMSGTNLQPNAGTSAQVIVAKQGGGTIPVSASSAAPTSLSFVVPAGAATGPFSLIVNTGSSQSPGALTIIPASSFNVSAAPSSADLIRGQTAAYAISLTSNSGFNQLTALSLNGLPSGVTATFKPAQITGGQTSVLSVTAPAGQPTGTATLKVSASTTIDGIAVTQFATMTLNIKPVTTSFLGRTVVSDSLETPLAGVTVTMLGKDGNGSTTGCSGSTVSDGAGNFALTSLSAMCVGPQLVGFDGLTATNPAGKYAGVNLVYTFTAGQVTPSPVLVHLPRIDNQETFSVQQNFATDQTYSFQSIPGLAVTVYAGTTFTMPDGSKPNPFPLTAVDVPVDRLPDAKPSVPTMMRVFIVAFQPANADTNQPVAVYFPNTINTPAGTNMVLMTLDPTRGQMVPYGTGTVSADGTQIVPDLDPSRAGHRFGLIHFDWHGGMPTPPAQPSPSPCGTCPGQTIGKPVDLASGIEALQVIDIAVNGPRGAISIERNYRSLTTVGGPFGIGTTHNYSYSLDTAFPQTAMVINLIAPDSNRIPFNKQNEGIFTNSTIAFFRGASIVVSPDNSTNLRFKDGTIYHFVSINFQLGSLLASIADANGNTVTLTRDPSNPVQITQITDPVGRSLSLTYDGSNRIKLVTDPIGRTVLYSYNSQGTLDTVTDPAGGMTRYAYDAQNRLTSVKDARDIVIAKNEYDPQSGRVIKQTQADGGAYKFTYTFLNPTVPTLSPVLTTVLTDPMGQQTTYRFNPIGYLTDSTDSSGQTRSYVRADGSNLTLAIQGAGSCATCGSAASGDQSFTYDNNGNVLTHTDALAHATTYTYEPVFNKVASITDPLGNTTSFTYDAKGNLLTRTDPNKNMRQYAYNAFGQVMQIIDPAKQKTTFTYDSFGNLATATGAIQKTTTIVYDGISRPIQTIDDLGRGSQAEYDALSRVISRTNAQGKKTKRDYDKVGNLTSLTDAGTNTTIFTYDGMNRLLSRKTPLGTSDSRVYDFNGNLTSFMDRRSQMGTFAYDNLNRLVSETYVDSTVTRNYDANGRLVQANDSASGVFAFAYDLAGRLTGSITPFGSVRYNYDNADRMMSRQVAGQAPLQYTYDKAGNLMNASTTGASVTRTYDPRNLVLTASRANGVSSQYGYDELGRLLSLTHSGPTGILNSHTYMYDSVGNRNSQTNNIAQPLITQAVPNATYDVNNEQTKFGGTTNTFDSNGNVASSVDSSGTTTYRWDARNRLASISAPYGQSTDLVYDFAGNLIKQADTGPTLNLTQTVVLDSLTNVAYLNRSDGDQYSVLTGQSVDQHDAAVHSNGQVEYGLSDALNSTIVTVDQAGSMKGRFFYEPFGQTTSSGSIYPFQFTGRVPTSTTLFYYRARLYSPTAARFISEDSVEVDEQSNLYEYAANNPGRFADPFGEAPGFAPPVFRPVLPTSCPAVPIGSTGVPGLPDDCVPVGDPICEPSRTYKGGTSCEQEYQCSDGPWTVHWIEVNGKIVHKPHKRPGSPKGKR